MEPAPEDQEETAVRHLLQENARLKQKVFELEEELRKVRGGGPSESKYVKLLELKDTTLEQYAQELEAKRDQLEKVVGELEKRNEQLQLWMSTLRLYQEFFENEPSAMIAVNREGRVVLFNRTAVEMLGEKFKAAHLKPIEEVDFRSFDPAIPRLARETLQGKRPADRAVRIRGRRVTTAYYPLGEAPDIRGALVKLTVVREKVR